MTLVGSPIEFSLAESSIANVPAERRGSGRDDVRLMVAHRAADSVDHGRFIDLEAHLRAGDVVVVNVSATVPAALEARTAEDRPVTVHLNAPAPGGLWSLEIRSPTTGGGTAPGPELSPQTLALPADAMVQLLAKSPHTPRLWIAALDGIADLPAYLDKHGRPIRYLPGRARPLADYQTVFASEPGSVEMPSAGRPFTPSLVTRLISRGVTFAPITLHAGVSSFEDHEVPGGERFAVPEPTARLVNALRDDGGRVVAVGTTVVRALETAADEQGRVHRREGLTDLVVTPARRVRAVDGLLTGWHEPRSSHLRLLEAFAGKDLLQRLYDEAVAGGYLWHEFGDELLMLP
jgi:S-adenosylmethionine:tRNA ribosyltransferase-isomerase